MADIERGSEITTRLMRDAGKSSRYFRHPFLHTGRSAETRASVSQFLAAHGYRVAPVSIDNYDYIFAAAFDRLRASSPAEAKRVSDAYLPYMEAVTAFYEQQSVAIVGREIRQILLIHANALNAQTFDALADRFERRGYRFVSLDRALEDPAYALDDEYFGPAGITWLHRWAMTQKKPSSIFAGEPEVPEWIAKAAQAPR